MKKLLVILTLLFILVPSLVLGATDVKNDVNLGADLVSYYEMETDGVRLDSVTGSGNDLTDNNTVATSSGILNIGGRFITANSEYLSIPDASQTGLDFTDGILTFSFWWNPRLNAQDFHYFVTKSFETGSQRGYWTAVNGSANTLHFLSSADGVTFGCNVSVAYNPVNSLWDHIVITKASTTVKFYIDGTQTGGDQTCSGDADIFDNTAQFELGRINDGGGLANYELDEIAIYSAEKTADDVTELYGGGTPPIFDAGTPSVPPLDLPLSPNGLQFLIASTSCAIVGSSTVCDFFYTSTSTPIPYINESQNLYNGLVMFFIVFIFIVTYFKRRRGHIV